MFGLGIAVMVFGTIIIGGSKGSKLGTAIGLMIVVFGIAMMIAAVG